jgi:uncharacterized membrane protein YkvI
MLLERPAESRAKRTVVPERITIARVAAIISYVLISTAIALSLIAALVHDQAAALGEVRSNGNAVVDLLALGGLALLGAVSTGVAAVNQQPTRLSSWVALVASGVALLVLLVASLPVTPYS